VAKGGVRSGRPANAAFTCISCFHSLGRLKISLSPSAAVKSFYLRCASMLCAWYRKTARRLLARHLWGPRRGAGRGGGGLRGDVRPLGAGLEGGTEAGHGTPARGLSGHLPSLSWLARAHP
jgi:hypothetical protein